MQPASVLGDFKAVFGLEVCIREEERKKVKGSHSNYNTPVYSFLSTLFNEMTHASEKKGTKVANLLHYCYFPFKCSSVEKHHCNVTGGIFRLSHSK